MSRTAVVLALVAVSALAHADEPRPRYEHFSVTLYGADSYGMNLRRGKGDGTQFMVQTFVEGRYNIDQLGYVDNDQAISVRVAPGWKVVLFEDADFKGRSVTLTADNQHLGDFANKTSSLIVTRPGVPTVAVKRGRQCAVDRAKCSFLGPATIYYGAADRWIVSKHPGPSVRCDSPVFGDPIVSAPKSCFVADEAPTLPASQGRKCADEGGFCARGPATIYYGAGDKWVAWKYELDVSCTAELLGDPNPGVTKSCYAEGEQPFLKSLPAKARKCADEGGKCKSFGSEYGPRMWLGFLYYGAGDAWVKINPPVGVMNCNSQTFGGDPAPGIKKACFNSTE